MKKLRKYSFVLLILFIILLQFVKPDTGNPPEDKDKFITEHIKIPYNVYLKLEAACFDCHSNRTKWPWYSKISPVVYLIDHDVKEGRRELNFSEWGNYDRKKMIKKLDEIEKEVGEGEMPPGIYKPLHPEAKLTDSDRKIISDWAKTSKENLSK
ncbi:MAG: heme-binding domain-containing protein [Ignavibacteriae bacterium]|nr:heme-binding domain-containing protein [Ignavibacteriota bacterium]